MGCGDLRLDSNAFQEQMPLHLSLHCIQTLYSDIIGFGFALYKTKVYTLTKIENEWKMYLYIIKFSLAKHLEKVLERTYCIFCPSEFK